MVKGMKLVTVLVLFLVGCGAVDETIVHEAQQAHAGEAPAPACGALHGQVRVTVSLASPWAPTTLLPYDAGQYDADATPFLCAGASGWSPDGCELMVYADCPVDGRTLRFWGRLESRGGAAHGTLDVYRVNDDHTLQPADVYEVTVTER